MSDQLAFEQVVAAHVSRNGEIPRIPWSTLAPAVVYDMDPGDHCVILGKTKSGKTTLAVDLLNRLADTRGSYVVALGYKLRDSTLRKTGWPIISEWPPTYEEIEPGHRCILWPPYSNPSNAATHTKPVFEDAFDDIMHEGNWRVFVDEIAYLIETLGMRRVLDEYFNGARSSGISMIAGTQRPVFVNRSAVSQVDWQITFRIEDLDDRTRAGEILGDKKLFVPVIGTLQKRRHEFLIVRESVAAISWIDYDPASIFGAGIDAKPDLRR